jgi:hypothetical protein
MSKPAEFATLDQVFPVIVIVDGDHFLKRLGGVMIPVLSHIARVSVISRDGPRRVDAS